MRTDYYYSISEHSMNVPKLKKESKAKNRSSSRLIMDTGWIECSGVLVIGVTDLKGPQLKQGSTHDTKDKSPLKMLNGEWSQ